VGHRGTGSTEPIRTLRLPHWATQAKKHGAAAVKISAEVVAVHDIFGHVADSAARALPQLPTELVQARTMLAGSRFKRCALRTIAGHPKVQVDLTVSGSKPFRTIKRRTRPADQICRGWWAEQPGRVGLRHPMGWPGRAVGARNARGGVGRRVRGGVGTSSAARRVMIQVCIECEWQPRLNTLFKASVRCRKCSGLFVATHHGARENVRLAKCRDGAESD
jgi:hypothetical protein